MVLTQNTMSQSYLKVSFSVYWRAAHIQGAGTSSSMQCVTFLQIARHKHNCSPVTRYHGDKLTLWLLWLTSTMMPFRWEPFGPSRHCGLFDKSSIAVLLTKTCGLQAVFLVAQHFGYSSFLSCFYLFQVLADLKQINYFFGCFRKCLFTKGQSSVGPFDLGLARLN